jgi:hypothetical protein
VSEIAFRAGRSCLHAMDIDAQILLLISGVADIRTAAKH